VDVLKFAQDRSGLHARRAVGESEMDQVRLSKNLLSRDGFAVIANHCKKWSSFSFPADDGALQRPAELWIRLDSCSVDAGDLAGLWIAIEQLRNTRIGFHNTQQHIGFAGNRQLKLLQMSLSVGVFFDASLNCTTKMGILKRVLNSLSSTFRSSGVLNTLL